MRSVKAIKRGFDGIKTREVGEVFDYAGPKGSWFVYLDPAPAGEKPAVKPSKAKVAAKE